MSQQPFAGLTVIEFGQFVAVPYCAQLLADGGAHVIKIEAHEGDPVRQLAPLIPGETRHFLSRNRGKHCLPLDLRHPQSARIIDALLAKADVALFNLRPGLADSLGLDYGTLSAKYPRLVTGNVTAFGREGPDRMLAGMDYVVQARSGLMASMGKVAAGLPTAGDTPIADFMCAVLLAFGVSSALFRREQTGRGGEVEASLLGASLVLQNTLFTRIAATDEAPDTELTTWLAQARDEGIPFAAQMEKSASIRPSYMSSVYYRTYQTRDSAIAVACASPALQRKFMEATGMIDALQGKQGTTERTAIASHYAAFQLEMEARLAERTTAEWKAVLDGAGIPASAVFLPVELLTDEQVLANGFIDEQEHWGLGPVKTLATPVKLDGTAFRPGRTTARFGSETREILAAAGLSAAEVDEAVSSGAVKEA